MNRQEQNALFTSKIIEGKDEEIARLEIKRDIDFEKGLKGKIFEVKALEKRLLKQDKIIGNLKKSISSLKDKLFKAGLKGTSSNFKNVCNAANTKQIMRILRDLEEHGKTNFKKLYLENCMAKSVGWDACNFLVKLNVIKEINERGVVFYERS